MSRARLGELAPFVGVDPHLLDELERCATLVQLGPEEALFSEGDPGDALYVVLSGRIQVRVAQSGGQAHAVAEVLPGELLGEMALLTQQPRAASAVAMDSVTVLRVPADACQQLMAASPEASDRLTRIALRRLPSLYLASSPFGRVRAALVEIDRAATWVRLSAGQVLFNQGDAPDAMYVVTHGSVEVLDETTGAQRRLSVVGRGEFLGEAAVLLDQPRSATVRALRDAELIRIPRDAFERAVTAEPALALELAGQAAQRLLQKDRTAPTTRPVRTVTLLPLDEAPETAEFARQLGAALGVEPVTPAGLRDSNNLPELGANDLADSRLRQWLAQQEELHPHVVYVAERDVTGWSRLALRQADLILLVACAESSPRPGAIERQLLSEGVRAPTQLVLLHSGGRIDHATGSGMWLHGREVVTMHHVRRQDPSRADVSRLARAIKGTSTCLVLGGGGARGLAHIGVIRALHEAHVSIDHVAGTSMGAIIAGLCALGHDYPTMLELVRQHYSGRGGFDITLPIVALRSARQTVKTLRALFADVNIEDLFIPFFCVSADLTRAETVVHDRGPLWLALRASCALPGVVPPVVYHGDLLVDGGLLNNVPADLMRQRTNGKIIAVDVSPKVDLTVASEGATEISGWQQLWTRMRSARNRSTTQLPSIVEILNRAVLLSSVRDSQTIGQQADLYLHPPVDSVAMGAFKSIDDAVDIGYRHAMDQLKVWADGRG